LTGYSRRNLPAEIYGELQEGAHKAWEKIEDQGKGFSSGVSGRSFPGERRGKWGQSNGRTPTKGYGGKKDKKCPICHAEAPNFRTGLLGGHRPIPFREKKTVHLGK